MNNVNNNRSQNKAAQPNAAAMNEMINKASQKIGTSPSELKKQIDNGKLDSIMKNLPPQQAKNFQNILQNPELAKKLMDTPQAKAIMKKFFNQP